MTPQSIITTARRVLQDTGHAGVALRMGDAELLGYVNEAVREVALLRPDLFSHVANMATTAGQVMQTLAAADAQRLLEVIGVVGGQAVTPMDRSALDQFRPSWRSDTAGPARHWAPVEGDPRRFFIYPQAPASQSLEVRYAREPLTYELTQAMPELSDVYEPALADYVIWRAESKDDEQASAQRARTHFEAFVAKVKAGA
jgi:hypothetical protein